MSAPATVGVAAAMLALGLPLVAGAEGATVAARAASAADAASLAAADATAGVLEAGEWIEPCALAARVAAKGGAELVFCQLDAAGGARVSAVARSGLVSVERRSRAGPPGT